MRRLSIVFWLILCTSGHSEKQREPLAEFSGEGLVKAPADFISLVITVHSDCQPSPTDAQSSTDLVVKKIDEYLRKLKTKGDKHFKILVDGGFTTTYSRWHRNREVCRNTFQKNTNITLKMAARNDFDKIFSDIQNYVLAHFEQMGLDELELARTYVTVGLPNPEVTREHRLTLEREAIDLALRDAKANFKAAIKSCEPHRWKVHSIKEGGGIEPSPRPFHYLAKFARSGSVPAPMDTVAPVRFDLLEITKNLLVTFQFEGALCFEP